MVDYFIVPASFLREVRSLLLTDERAVADHAVLVLHLDGRQYSSPPPPEPETDPCFFRFRRPADPVVLATAAAHLAANPWLAWLEAAANAGFTSTSQASSAAPPPNVRSRSSIIDLLHIPSPPPLPPCTSSVVPPPRRRPVSPSPARIRPVV